jgi:hypothetical protein
MPISKINSNNSFVAQKSELEKITFIKIMVKMIKTWSGLVMMVSLKTNFLCTREEGDGVVGNDRIFLNYFFRFFI